jgi:hypothetical protein
MKGHAVVQLVFLGFCGSFARAYCRTDALPLCGELAAPWWPRNRAWDIVLPHRLEDADARLAGGSCLHLGQLGASSAVPLALHDGGAGRGLRGPVALGLLGLVLGVAHAEVLLTVVSLVRILVEAHLILGELSCLQAVVVGG